MHERHWDFGGRGGPFGGRGGIFGKPGKPPRAGRPDFSDFFGGPPPRADRGVVRYLVLDAIARQPTHGYEIIQAIGERSAGTYRPSPGVVYPTLQMLEELGHAKVEESESRKVYAITAEGKEDLKGHRDEVEEFYAEAGEGSWEDLSDELHELIHRVGKMFKLIGRAARRGRLSPALLKKLRVVVEEAIGKVEAIVAPDERD
jgi:DNA-binding PadR family transcriptional regulator